jgi:hypothetical protein
MSRATRLMVATLVITWAVTLPATDIVRRAAGWPYSAAQPIVGFAALTWANAVLLFVLRRGTRAAQGAWILGLCALLLTLAVVLEACSRTPYPPVWSLRAAIACACGWVIWARMVVARRHPGDSDARQPAHGP